MKNVQVWSAVEDPPAVNVWHISVLYDTVQLQDATEKEAEVNISIAVRKIWKNNFMSKLGFYVYRRSDEFGFDYHSMGSQTVHLHSPCKYSNTQSHGIFTV